MDKPSEKPENIQINLIRFPKKKLLNLGHNLRIDGKK
jgi:hypothetical protein